MNLHNQRNFSAQIIPYLLNYKDTEEYNLYLKLEYIFYVRLD